MPRSDRSNASAPTPRTARRALGALAVTLAACGKAPEPPKTPLAMAPDAPAGVPDLSAAARASLDSGNALLRGGDATGALVRYRAAAAAAPGNATPWYGVMMAAQRLQDASLADSARRMVARLSGNPELSDSGLQALHGQGGTGGALPPGHPGGGLPPGHPQAGTPPGHPPVGGSSHDPMVPRPSPKKTR